MKLLTWNVQWCRGIDGTVDPARIANVVRRLGDFDVVCLQEIAMNFPGLPGSRGEDQVLSLAALFPGHEPHFAAATDVEDGRGGRSQFGNLILSRLPVLQVYRHLLPWPVDAVKPSMQRIAIEAVVRVPWGTIRITTTHLEYYSARQRRAQVEALRLLHAEACAHAAAARPSGESGGPFEARPRPASGIITGDFNFNPASPDYQRMTARFDDGAAALIDAWQVAHPGMPHPPTVGIFENSFSAQPDCFDFLFLTADLAARVKAVVVDGATEASDHQPVMLELRD